MLFRKKGPSTIVTSVLQWGFTVLLNYLGGLGRYFLLCIKYALLFMWDFAVGCHMFCYCLFLPPKPLKIPQAYVLFTSFCGIVFYQCGWVGETQFHGFFVEY